MKDSINPIRPGSGEILEFAWGQINWLVSGSLGNSTALTIGRVIMKAGCANPVHRHPNCDEVLHVLRGRIEHTLGGATLVLNAGDTISIPANVWHNARVLGEAGAEMIICFSSPDRQTETDGSAG